MKMYRTPDFYLSITLCTLGFTLAHIDKTEPRHYIFEFEDVPDLYPYIEQYFRNELRINPRLILINAKLLRDRMYE